MSKCNYNSICKYRENGECFKIGSCEYIDNTTRSQNIPDNIQELITAIEEWQETITVLVFQKETKELSKAILDAAVKIVRIKDRIKEGLTKEE